MTRKKKKLTEDDLKRIEESKNKPGTSWTDEDLKRIKKTVKKDK